MSLNYFLKCHLIISSYRIVQCIGDPRVLEFWAKLLDIPAMKDLHPYMIKPFFSKLKFGKNGTSHTQKNTLCWPIVVNLNAFDQIVRIPLVLVSMTHLPKRRQSNCRV